MNALDIVIEVAVFNVEILNHSRIAEFASNAPVNQSGNQFEEFAILHDSRVTLTGHGLLLVVAGVSTRGVLGKGLCVHKEIDWKLRVEIDCWKERVLALHTSSQ